MIFMDRKSRLIVFASGTKDGGGSGSQVLDENRDVGNLEADIVAFVSNHENGGTRKRADALKVPFRYFPGPWTVEEYQKIVREYNAQWIALSGWLKPVKGLSQKRTINIHPGPLPRFGGKGMYGVHVHEAVLEAFQKGEVSHTEVTMHFVTEKYDEGPVFLRYPVAINKNDTAETLATRVNEVEHVLQPLATNLVIHEQIAWDGLTDSVTRRPAILINSATNCTRHACQRMSAYAAIFYEGGFLSASADSPFATSFNWW